MKIFESKDIRNVALLGHGGSGKTMLAEAMAYKTKLIDRMGKVEDGSTISDYDPEEQARSISISTSLIPLEYNKTKINILDTPGYFDFVGEQLQALRVADAVIIVVDAMSGVEVGTEKAWEMLEEMGMPCMIVVNKLDRENVEFEKTIDSITSLFGSTAMPVQIPLNPGVGFNKICSIGSAEVYEYEKETVKVSPADDETLAKIADYRETLIETAASANEDLMEKYLETEELSAKELSAGMKQAIMAGELMPILCTTATDLVGIDLLLESIVNLLPSPIGVKNEEINADEAESVFVFKTIADPYVGKLSLFKVMSGAIEHGLELHNVDTDQKEKINHIYTLIGKKQVELDKINTGDIGAFSKLNDTVTNNVLCSPKCSFEYKKIEFPQPNFFQAISSKSKGDEDKLSNGLARAREEDQTIIMDRNQETHQSLIYGIGEMQIQVLANKLKTKYGVEVELEVPIIPYRETIKKKAVAEGKHKKQSGGSGQYGVVTIEFEPTFDLEVPLEFVDKVVGGSVPRQFIPAVEKGLIRSIEKGVLAGYPVVGLRATLIDGKYHPVDSDEMSFSTAASLAYREGLQNAKPVLLEPIYKVSIVVPEKYMGDIMGDLNKKRGKIMGMDTMKGGKERINAEAPLSEMFNYAIELRSITQARGSFEMEFEKYEEVPSAFADKIIADAKAKEV